DESISVLRKAVEMDPSFGYAHQTLATAYQAKGDLRNAIAEFEKAKQVDDAPVILAEWAAAKAWAGDKGTARKTLAELDVIAQRREVVAYVRAVLHLSLGDKDEAMRWLERSFEEGDGANIDDFRYSSAFEAKPHDVRQCESTTFLASSSAARSSRSAQPILLWRGSQCRPHRSDFPPSMRRRGLCAFLF